MITIHVAAIRAIYFSILLYSFTVNVNRTQLILLAYVVYL